MGQVALRPYQKEAIEAVRRARERSVPRSLISLPTGTGKTYIAANLPDALALDISQRTLFLVRTDEQAQQAVLSFQRVCPQRRPSLEMGKQRHHPDSSVIVASIQTLSRPERRSVFPRDHFSLVFTDEAHHATARQYLSTLEYFQVLKGHASCDPSKLLCGITATPRRADTIGLEAVFDEIVYHRSIRDMIREGWLVDVIGYQVHTGVDISDVSKHHGDFSIAPLERRVNTPERNALVVEKYLEIAPGKPFLAFTVDIAHSCDLAEEFRRKGVECYAVSGKTPMQVRRRLVEAFTEGRIPGLCSCAVFNEGTDFPIATVGLMCRPTLSSVWYTQSVGRILRPYPPPEQNDGEQAEFRYRKEKAIIIDFTDNCERHSLFTIPCLFGLPPKFRLNGQSAERTAQQVDQIERSNPGIAVRSYLSIEEIHTALRETNLFHVEPVEVAPARYSRYTWVTTDGECFRLSLPNRIVLRVQTDQLGRSLVVLSSQGQEKILHSCNSREEAFRVADSYVPSDAVGIVLRNARWRNQPPTDKQAAFLWNLDRRLQQRFPHPNDFWKYCMKAFKSGNKSFTKGGLSHQIESLRLRRTWNQLK